MTQFIDTTPTNAPKILAMLGFSAGSFSIIYNLVIPSLLYTDGDEDETRKPEMFFRVAVFWVSSAVFSIFCALAALLTKFNYMNLPRPTSTPAASNETELGRRTEPSVSSSIEIGSPIHRESNKDLIPPPASEDNSDEGDDEKRVRKMTIKEYENLRESYRYSSIG